MADLSAEERARAVRAALAEAGYPEAVVTLTQDDEFGEVVRIMPGPPREMVWRAWAVAREPALACWACWRDAVGGWCSHDPLTSPWPEGP